MRDVDDLREPAYRPFDGDGGAEHDARTDVVEGLAEWFEPAERDGRSAWEHRVDLVAEGELTNGRVTAVAWRYHAEPRRDVWGVASDRGPVAIEGVTFVDHGDEQPSFARYIDWHGVFEQLGVAAAGQIVREPTR